MTTVRGRSVNLPGVEFAVEEVDADVARAWLEVNLVNRTPVKHKIAQYKRAISAGRWDFTGEAIKFDRNGVLLDGQNRLIAVKETGRSIVTLVIRGLDEAARLNMDTGAARRAGQVLTMLGHSRGNNLAAVAQVAILRYRDLPLASGRCTHDEVLQFVKDHPELELAVKNGRGLPMATAAASFVTWVLTDIDAVRAVDFLAELRTGANLREKSPVLTARAKLGRIQADTKTNRGIRVEAQIGTVFYAWNKWLRRADCEKIYLPDRPDGRPAIPDPEQLGYEAEAA